MLSVIKRKTPLKELKQPMSYIKKRIELIFNELIAEIIRI
jgi:hypothetical protein